MNIIWHIVKKDLVRFRLPLAIWVLLLVAKTVFYAVISGLVGAPNLEWQNRLMQGPEFLLRFFLEPVITYFLVGWLVFEDSPVEKDSHWIMRPISGGQLFGAKLAGAVLLFVLLPVAVSWPWWLACGFGWPELLQAAGMLAGINAALVSLALLCASLTDGFPRFILWSVVGLGSCSLVQLIFGSNVNSSIYTSRLVVWAGCGSLCALAVAAHQYVTRRHRKSLALAVAGALVVGVLGQVWRWDVWHLAPGAETAAYRDVRLLVTEPARYVSAGRFVKLPLKIDGVPATATVRRIRLRGDWSIKGTKVWTSQAYNPNWKVAPETIRRILGLDVAGAPAQVEVGLNLTFSPALMAGVARDSAAFHGEVELNLSQDKVAVEMPMKPGILSSGGCSYTLSDVETKRVKVTRARSNSPGSPAPMEDAIACTVTERSGDFFNIGIFSAQYALVNRKTGEFLQINNVYSGPMGGTILSGVSVFSWRLTFTGWPASVPLADLVLVGTRSVQSETIKRTLDLDPKFLPEAGIPQG